jgi:hypothetical protein
MKSLLFLSYILFLFFGCVGKGSPGYESLKLTIEEQEKSAPITFLTVDGKLWENLFGQTVIEGDITSSATVAKFKDVVLKVNFYTKTGTFLGSEEFVVYEFVNPGQSVHFKVKSFGPESAEKIDVELSKAVSVD